jgi:hypothetical protein
MIPNFRGPRFAVGVEPDGEARPVTADEVLESNTDELVSLARCECCGYLARQDDLDEVSGWCPACRGAVDSVVDDDCLLDDPEAYAGPLFEGCKSQD